MEFSEELKAVVAQILVKGKVDRSDIRSIQPLVSNPVKHWVTCPKRLEMTGDQFVRGLAETIASFP